MVRVVMRQEDVPEARQCNAGEYELARNTIATIDHVRAIVDEDDLCGRGVRLSWSRSPSRPEEDQRHSIALPGRQPRPESRTGNGRCPNEKSASTESRPHYWSTFTRDLVCTVFPDTLSPVFRLFTQGPCGRFAGGRFNLPAQLPINGVTTPHLLMIILES